MGDINLAHIQTTIKDLPADMILLIFCKNKDKEIFNDLGYTQTFFNCIQDRLLNHKDTVTDLTSLHLLEDHLKKLKVKNAGILNVNSNSVENNIGNKPSTSKTNSHKKNIVDVQKLQESLIDSDPGPSSLSERRSSQNIDSSNSSIHKLETEHIVILTTHCENPKFRFTRKQSRMKIKTIPSNEDPESWVRSAIADALNHTRSIVTPHSHAGMTIYPEDNPTSKANVHFRLKDQIDADVVMAAIGLRVQSNETFMTSGDLIIQYDTVDVPHGNGRIKPSSFMYRELCNKKKAILQIRNKDSLCLARAIVTLIAMNEHKSGLISDTKWNGIRQGKKIQDTLAESLCEEADVNLQFGGGLPEIEKFQDHLKERFILTIFHAFGDVSNTLYNGYDHVENENKKNKRLNIVYYENHFDCITSLKAYFEVPYLCEMCLTTFTRKKHYDFHRCKFKCEQCQQDTERCTSTTAGVKITCNECLLTYKNSTCYSNHKECKIKCKKTNIEVSICETRRKCKECFKLLHKNDVSTHICNTQYCGICKRHRENNHQCYMIQYSQSPLPSWLFIFFDFECTQDEEIAIEVYEHKPNLCVVQTVCSHCEGKSINEECEKCGEREHLFIDKPVDEFYRFINKKQFQSNFKAIRVLSHNFKGYDGHFILKYMVQEMKLCPRVIMNGKHIICMDIPKTKVKFLDSLSYFPMPLSAFPKAFGLPPDISKGYFPHFFNKEVNKNYAGPYPDKSYYGYDEMKTLQDREKFDNWYNEERANNDHFNLQIEIIKYCKMDVTVLRLACMKFREDFIAQNGIDPFMEAATIAGAAMKVFRKNYLHEGDIGIAPKGGYRMADVQSNVALEWLEYESWKRNITIQHAGNGREWYESGCGKIDGYYKDADGKKYAFEFNGCYYHGHTCLTGGRNLPLVDDPDDTLDERRTRTLIKMERLKKKGFLTVEMTECRWYEMRKKDTEVREFLCNVYTHLNKHETLNFRDAFFGGRVNCTKTYYKADVDAGEKIMYVDFTSLYPTVNKYDKYPIGHPTNLLVGHEKCKDFKDKDGFIKLQVLPPQNLYHPVLPYRVNDRLMFPLCRRCVELESKEPCTHSVDDRVITGTYVIDEVNLAVEHGYKPIQCYEIVEYETTKYNPKTKIGGLFAAYVNQFLKMKQEASGWPRENMNADEKLEYILNYLEHEGVELDYNNIRHNPSLRALAKLMLNSLWGKFGQRNNLPQSTFINKAAELYSMLTNPCLQIKYIEPITKETFLVNWAYKENVYVPSQTVNIPIAAYTTTFARMRLYKLLAQLGEQVLYYDTDSVIYSWKPGQVQLPTGDYLGDLTDEVAEYGSGSFIYEYVSGGPKNYSYKIAIKGDLSNTKTICKVKGLNLNFKNSQIVNFDLIRSKVLRIYNKSNNDERDNDDESDTVVTMPRQIRRLNNHTIVSREETKVYRPVYKKRIIVENNDSLPYGFIRQ